MISFKICSRCQNFKRHYTLCEVGYLSLDFGHCSNSNMRRSNPSNRTTCKYFEEINLEKITERKQNSLKYTIYQINKNLRNLCEYLEIDKINLD